MAVKKYFYSSNAVCPLYRGETPGLIRCGEEYAQLHNAFPNRREKKEHTQEYCYTDKHTQCPNYISIEIFSKLTPENQQLVTDMMKRMK